MKLKREVIDRIQELARERPDGWGILIKDIIDSWTEDERAELIALVDLGRNQGATTKDWDDMVQDAKQIANGSLQRLTATGSYFFCYVFRKNARRFTS